jgi:hypothetical protein
MAVQVSDTTIAGKREEAGSINRIIIKMNYQ